MVHSVTSCRIASAYSVRVGLIFICFSGLGSEALDHTAEGSLLNQHCHPSPPEQKRRFENVRRPTHVGSAFFVQSRESWCSPGVGLSGGRLVPIAKRLAQTLHGTGLFADQARGG